MVVINKGIQLFEQGYVPDFLVRMGIRRLLKDRIDEETRPNNAEQQVALTNFVEELKSLPIAIETKSANEQHYEVDTRFYNLCLGKNLKYSCAYYPLLDAQNSTSLPISRASELLDEAEVTMFDMYAQRAELTDGLRVLELGCGWGSLILYNAARFPKSTFVGVSYSNSQREHIMAEAAKRGLNNVQILTADMRYFELPENMGPFDRVVSIEMFEHMKNYERLLAKVSSFLKPQGKLFVHIFTHKTFAYHFVAKNDEDWMARYFFTGGTMPSAHLLHYFQRNLTLAKHWQVNGNHYALTSEAWLQNMDANRDRILELFAEYYGKENSMLWFVRWRAFYLACAELFAYNGGNEWFVSHYLFENRSN